MKKLSSKEKMRQIRMLKKNLKKMKLRKNKNFEIIDEIVNFYIEDPVTSKVGNL